MIKATSLLKILNSLIGQQFEIDHVNVSTELMKSVAAVYRRIKIYEIKYFDDYIIVYIQSTPVVLKSYGWRKYNTKYDLYFDSATNQFYSHLFIKLK